MDALERYVKAAECLRKWEADEKALEQDYIRRHGILNSDGSVPERVEDIEDDDAFNAALEVVYGDDNDTLVRNLDAAKLEEKEAADAVVGLALSLMPAGENRDSLERACNDMEGWRERVIETMLQMGGYAEWEC